MVLHAETTRVTMHGTGVPNYGESVRGVRKSAIFSRGVADCGESGTGVQKSSYLGR